MRCADRRCAKKFHPFFISWKPIPPFVWRGPTELFQRGKRLYGERADKEWSLTDCISFVAMQDEGVQEALTGDQHFEQAGFKALLV